MTTTLLMLKGLPASGKTTRAFELVKKGWKRINKDDLRDMVDGGKWSRDNEKVILILRDLMVQSLLARGHNVVVDDTNLAKKHESVLKQLAHSNQAQFQVEDMDVDPVTCIRRDLKRDRSVGSSVIWRMYNQYLAPKNKVQHDPGLPWAIICDLDGTLSLHNGRNPYDASTCDQDIPDPAVLATLKAFQDTRRIIYLSGRSEDFRQPTNRFLVECNAPRGDLFMRSSGDSRKDFLVKQELFEENIKGKYNVLFVMDDRDQVVHMWRGLGLKCFQVNYGDF